MKKILLGVLLSIVIMGGMITPKAAVLQNNSSDNYKVQFVDNPTDTTTDEEEETENPSTGVSIKGLVISSLGLGAVAFICFKSQKSKIKQI